MTYLAVPIAAENLNQAGKQIKAAKAGGAEILELRTDYLQSLSVDLVEKLVAEARSATGKAVPIIVTCRDKRQGGAIDYPDKLRVEILTAALKAGAEFIDFEYENFLTAENKEKIKLALSQTPKGKLILSTHDFETKFTNIDGLYHHILSVYRAAIPKLVYTANHINDCFDALDLLHRTTGQRTVFCMGEPCIISRIIAKKLGSFDTFASIDDKTATAPGQLTIQQLKELYRYDSINSETELFGVIGSPVAHSLSPAIHNASFTKARVNKVYLPLLVEGGKQESDQFMQNILARPWLGFHGLSVTIPHKRNALDFVRENKGSIEPLAEKIGAANTLVIDEDGGLSAYNTDCAAALDAIKSGFGKGVSLKDLPVAVIGAGGVARAIVAGLSDAGAKIKIYNRTVKKAESLAAEFDCDFAGLDELPKLDTKLVINCTSIGMHPNTDSSILPKEYIKKDMIVFDTVYNPADTLLLKEAKEAGAKTIDGLSMFINQAAAQFKLFTNQEADLKLMRKTATNCFS
ncbi:MAG: shikimate dehydrogenase [Planctomycetota bacterium]|jgi:3-dehydroquinate dehydratase/shikimate dehydrogenase